MGKKKILITGAGGFVGGHLVEELLRRGDVLTVVVRQESAQSDRLKGKGVKVVVQDLVEGFLPEEIVSDQSVIIHLATQLKRDEKGDLSYFANNAVSTLNLVESIRMSRSKPLLIFLSSSRVYEGSVRDDNGIVMVDESYPVQALHTYGSSKIFGETLCKTLSETYHVPVIILRIGYIYGPGQPANLFLSDMLKKIHEAKDKQESSIEVRATHHHLNFIYVGDVVDLLMDISDLERPVSSEPSCEIYNVAKDFLQLSSVIGLMQQLSKESLGFEFTVKTKTPEGKDQAPVEGICKLECGKVRETFGWEPKTAIQDGLRTMINQYPYQSRQGV